MEEVIFRKKSLWQKDDCIGINNHGCQGKSVLEAVLHDSIVRCCENEECKAMAKELAEIPSSLCLS